MSKWHSNNNICLLSADIDIALQVPNCFVLWSVSEQRLRLMRLQAPVTEEFTAATPDS